MGNVSTISWVRYPKQSEFINRRCQVCFHYDTEHMINGTIIRDDREEPCETIIMMDDGRIVRGVECQYTICVPISQRGDFSCLKAVSYEEHQGLHEKRSR